jgi:hypothetical protein
MKMITVDDRESIVLKFCMELERDQWVRFLDIPVNPSLNRSLWYVIYMKPTYTVINLHAPPTTL